MILAIGGRVLLNVVTRGMRLVLSLVVSFKVSSLGTAIAFFLPGSQLKFQCSHVL